MKKSILKMYNSVIECGKSIKYIYWVKKKTYLGLFERCDSIEDIKRRINE